jgi:hypothetical protein
MNERDTLIAKITAQQLRPGDIVVTLEDFFVGNADRGSIGCNLGKSQPAISTFYEVLSAIRAREDVQDVLVRICEFNEPGRWPYGDTIYILTSASLDDVQNWVRPLRPDEVNPEWMYGPPPKAPALEPQMKPYSVWWD